MLNTADQKKFSYLKKQNGSILYFAKWYTYSFWVSEVNTFIYICMFSVTLIYRSKVLQS